MKITRNDIDNAIRNLNREAAHEGVGTTYSVNQFGKKYSIRVRSGGFETNAVDTCGTLTTREAFFAVCGLLRGRQQQREDRRRAVFGTTVVA